jgi:hypothetical protein
VKRSALGGLFCAATPATLPQLSVRHSMVVGRGADGMRIVPLSGGGWAMHYLWDLTFSGIYPGRVHTIEIYRGRGMVETFEIVGCRRIMEGPWDLKPWGVPALGAFGRLDAKVAHGVALLCIFFFLL